MSWNYYGFRPYVSVAERQRNAQRELVKLARKGLVVQPIKIDGRTIAQSFWGKAWCDDLESYMDYENRLPRGRTYVRNGSVVHLDVQPGEIQAMVSGSEMYKVKISIVPAAKAKWKALCRDCAGGIGSLVELLQGRLSDRVMDIITRKGTGLFPTPAEIKMSCSCPDWAGLCKHIAAVLYGVGARLDQSPDLLFVLRSVNHEELITHAAAATDLTAKANASGPGLAESELGAVFGIELDTESVVPAGRQKPSPAAHPGKTQASHRTQRALPGKARAQIKAAAAAKPKADREPRPKARGRGKAVE